MIAEVALPLPLDRTFSYKIPDTLRGKIKVGQRVLVPIKNREIVGYILGQGEGEGKGLKEIIAPIEDGEVFPHSMLPFLRWLSSYYVYPIGMVIKEVLPFKDRVPATLNVQVIKDLQTEQASCPDEAAFLKRLSVRRSGIHQQHSIIRRLLLSGHLRIKTPSKKGRQFQESPFLRPGQRSVYQEAALTQIGQSIDTGKFEVFLLHGVTGSGKTEVYMEAIQRTISKGKSAILMVPEIALSLYMEAFFRSVFQDGLAVYHSRLSPSNRDSQWMGMLFGHYRVVLGARSAIFSPFEELGLIIVDEEHDHSYKQDTGLRYNARDLAVIRGTLCNCPVILGSATPSVRSYYNAKLGKYKLILMPQRIENRPLPKMELVDMTKRQTGKKGFALISDEMKEAMERTLASERQVMVFHSRRGFYRMFLCQACGNVLKCPECDIAMIHHLENNRLLCHYCGKNLPVITTCPKCKKESLKAYGYGTERVEEELKGLFPHTRVERLDTDALKKKDLVQIIEDFKANKIQILVGTQIITKGYDFPNVTLVAIISSDLLLNFPDYNASERTFQLITQVAGRAGRGNEEGTVLIQSYNPWHYSINCAISHDYGSFYQHEIELRQKLIYPPFCHMILLTLIGRDKYSLFEDSKKLRNEIQSRLKSSNLEDKIITYGPSPSPLSKLKGSYRFQILLKTKHVMEATRFLRKLAEDTGAERSFKMLIDVDPYDMF